MNNPIVLGAIIGMLINLWITLLIISSNLSTIARHTTALAAKARQQ